MRFATPRKLKLYRFSVSSSPKAFSISAKHAALWVTHLSTQPGFCFLPRPDGSAFLSAWPESQWFLPRATEDWEAVCQALRQAERDLTANLDPSRDDTGEVFSGGLIGCLHYEAGRHTVPGFQATRHGASTGDAGWVGLFTWALELPAQDGEPALLRRLPCCSAETTERLNAIVNGPPPQAPGSHAFRMTSTFQPVQTRPAVMASVRRILDYIQAGDCYQVNLSQQFEGRYEGAPFAAFESLREAIPVPHAGYVDAGPWQVLSISPERYLRIDGARVESKPIKGTRARGDDPAEDTRLREELVNSLKDRAENLMIVDLIRNDLSHFCRPYSVRVPQLFDVESYRNVHQLVSTVTGELKDDVLRIDALLSAFPGGSITGAPKRRAMEIIDELEPHERGPYCGSVFALSAGGVLESNIAIRTLMTDAGGRIRCWGGGGIVADSDPGAEYAESVTKVQRLMKTLDSL